MTKNESKDAGEHCKRSIMVVIVYIHVVRRHRASVEKKTNGDCEGPPPIAAMWLFAAAISNFEEWRCQDRQCWPAGRRKAGRRCSELWSRLEYDEHVCVYTG